MIVGATDGIGLALALELARRGWRLCLVGRNPEKLERAREQVGLVGLRLPVETALCDVADEAEVDRAYNEGLASLGRLDLLVYCAGALEPALTGLDRLAGAKRTLDVNVLGAVRFLERGAEHMTQAARGRLAAIGSIAGVRGRRGNPVYGASKAALHTYLEGLRHRLHRHGVGVSTVKPGFVRTRMLPKDAPGYPPAISATDAARKIADGLERGRDDFFVPWWWAVVAFALRVMPVAVHKRFAPP